ncbi:MAG: hypothetical protein AAF922_07665 [Pseudomonadota bacterium]
MFGFSGSACAQNALKSFCDGDCGIHLFTGEWVTDSQLDVFVTDPIFPWQYDYLSDERIYGLALSKRMWTIFKVIDVEPELGFAIRTGEEDAEEIWAALYFRFDQFPWRETLYTSIAISTGLNYATRVTQLERDRAGADQKLLHYLSPEISFALPKYEQYELVFRFHHRSGGYGTIGGADGGAQYGTVGFRLRF